MVRQYVAGLTIPFEVGLEAPGALTVRVYITSGNSDFGDNFNCELVHPMARAGIPVRLLTSC